MALCSFNEFMIAPELNRYYGGIDRRRGGLFSQVKVDFDTAARTGRDFLVVICAAQCMNVF